MFWKNFSAFGDNTALVEGDRRLSYQDLHDQVAAFAERLGNTKSLILVAGANTIDSIIGLYGAFYGDHACIYCDGDNQDLIDSLIAKFNPNWIYQSGEQGWHLSRLNEQPLQLHPELTLILSTSGSTGSTKSARLSADNIQSNTDAVCDYLPINEQQRAALLLPIHYIYGLTILHTHLARGACVYPSVVSVMDEGFVDYLKDNRITTFPCVPYTFEMLERIDFRAQSLPDLDYLTQSGAKFHAALLAKYADWAESHNKQLFVMYGATEAAGRLAYMPPQHLKHNLDSVGVVINNSEFILKDDSGQIIEQPDTEGQLYFRGPGVMMGYAQSTDDLALGRTLDELETGDIAKFNEQGIYTLLGRTKRIAKLFGKRFSLDDIEAFLSNQHISATCVSDDQYLYVCSESKQAASLVQTISDKFELPANFIQLVHFEQLPLLTSGKVNYKAMLETAAAAPKDDLQLEGSVPDKIRQIYKKALAVEEVGDLSFAELGGNSLVYVSVSMELEKVLGTIPHEWPQLSVEKLATHAKAGAKPSIFASVEAGIMLRLYASLAVVFNHAGVTFFKGGAALLMVIAGFNYLRFQFDEQKRSNPARIFPSLIKNIVVPYMAVLVGFNFLKGLETDIFDVLMIGANIPGRGSEPFGIWYIQELIISLVIVTLPLFVPQFKRWISQNPLGYTFILIGFSIVIRVIDGSLGIGRHYDLNGEQISWVFWMFALGMLVFLNPPRLKIVTIALAIILPVWFYWGDSSRYLNVAIGTLILLTIPHVKVPRFTVPAITALASASLFIYILHPRAPIDTVTATWTVDVLRIGIGVLLGLIGYYAYNWGLGLAEKWFNALLARFRKSNISQVEEN